MTEMYFLIRRSHFGNPLDDKIVAVCTKPKLRSIILEALLKNGLVPHDARRKSKELLENKEIDWLDISYKILPVKVNKLFTYNF
jgi:hypothetical protein